MMRGWLLSAVVYLAMTPALGADWVAIATGDGNQHYYDRSKIFAASDEVTYWRRVAFSTAHPVKGGFARSAMYRERIQCKQYRITTLGYLLYSSDGSVLENVYSPDAQASPIVPETVGERFQRVMCALAGAAPEPPAAPQPAPASSVAPPKKKAEGDEEIRKEIDRLEQLLKRLRERLGD